MSIENVFENSEPDIQFEPDAPSSVESEKDFEAKKLRQANAYISSATETILMIAMSDFLHDEFKAGPEAKERKWRELPIADRTAYIASATERYAKEISKGAPGEAEPLVEEAASHSGSGEG